MSNSDNPKNGKSFEQEYVLPYFKDDLKINDIGCKDAKLKLHADSKEGEHKFDLVSREYGLIIECKCHTWTAGDNCPSAKMSVWNEAMYYFYLANEKYKKLQINILCVRKAHKTEKKLKGATISSESLAEYYIRNKRHYIPKMTYILEFDIESKGDPVLAYPEDKTLNDLKKIIRDNKNNQIEW